MCPLCYHLDLLLHLFLPSLLLSSTEAVYKSSCCLTLHAISQHSPDVLKAHAGVALPLAFLGMHQQQQEEESTRGECAEAELWAEMWQEHVPGTFGGIRLYMSELIAITQKALQSQSWKMKAQGGAAMASIARQQTGSLVAPYLGMLLTALLQALAGRTWAGKVSSHALEHFNRNLFQFIFNSVFTCLSSCSFSSIFCYDLQFL